MDANQKDPQYIIYALHHPNSKYVYVGKSSKGRKRPQAHSSAGHLKSYAHLPRAKWIQSLKKRGLEPKIVILEVCARVEDLDEAEKFYIACFRAIDVPLLNLTDGGDGINGYRHSDKARARMSEKHKRLANTKEGRSRLTSQARNYWADPEAREKQSEARRGKKWSEETKAKIASSVKGKPKSAAHRAALSEARKRNWATPGYREKQIAAQKAAYSTEEAKARSAESANKAWADPEYQEKVSISQKAAWDGRRRHDRK